MADNENNEAVLENQLHEQYAVNDNNRIGVFTSFIVGIIALFGFYGYVFVNTNKRKCWNFDIQEFLLMSFITIGILFFLALLSLYLGYSLRRDHFIVNNIREKRYKKETKAEMERIFGELYSPKNKSCSDFLPDYYNLFYWLFFSSEIFLFITAILKISDFDNSFCNWKNILCVFIVMLFHVIFIISTLISRKCYHNKYKEINRQKDAATGPSAAGGVKGT